MSEKQYKAFEQGKVLEVLQTLNYHPIQDCGKFFRTKALYRDGDSPNSLLIFKDSGWCTDFPADEKFSLYELVKRTLGTTNHKTITSLINAQQVVAAAPKQKLKMQKTYNPDCLERLFPNYSFYNKKKISDETLKAYKMGLATQGKMYQRLVFPIFNENGQIIGFSGRHFNWSEESNLPKWKHIGEKKDWIFPFYSVPECREKTDIADEIALVESIGDSLACFENVQKNHLVTFGLEVSSSILAFLLSKDLKKITVATNNDFDGVDKNGIPTNRGKTAAIKNMMKLSTVFPIDMLEIKLPTKNDFGEMHEFGDSFLDWKNQKPLDREEIVKYIGENRSKFNDQKVGKFLKKL